MSANRTTEKSLYKKPDPNALRKTDLRISFANSVSLSLIFACRQFFFPIFLVWGKGLLLPFNAIANIARGVLSVYEAHQKKYPTRNVIRAIVFMLGGCAMATAITGSLVAAAAFTLINPILTIIGFGSRCFYYAGMGIMRAFELKNIKDPIERRALRNDAIADAINSLANACSAIAIGLVLIAFNGSFGVLGVIGGIIGIIGASCEWLNLRKDISPSSMNQEKDQSQILTNGSTSYSLRLLRCPTLDASGSSVSISEDQVRDNSLFGQPKDNSQSLDQLDQDMNTNNQPLLPKIKYN